ncbi:HAD family hydrolase [Agrococcus lahaulensis]|nr:HAD family hydrolase [Agrococcus lahaulensis]
MLSRFTAIGFDLDGTLFDHRGSALVGVDEFLGSLGVATTAFAHELWLAAEATHFERWRAGEITFEEQRRERLRTVLPALGIEAPDRPAALDALFARYADAYRRSWRAFDDAAQLLRLLRRSGLRLGLLTNGTREQQHDKLRAIGLIDEFDVICISEEIGVAKPDARAFSALAEQLEVDPDQCLFVGDNAEHDVLGASAAGMAPLLVDRYGQHSGGITDSVLAHLSR